MKHLFFNILLIGCCLPIFVSCDDEQQDSPDYSNQETKPTKAYIYLKEHGEEELTVYSNGVSSDYTFSVVKGGKQDVAANAKLEVMTQDEVNETYGDEGFNYIVIPEDSYNLPEPTDIAFSDTEDMKEMTVSLNAKQMQDIAAIVLNETNESENGNESGSGNDSEEGNTDTTAETKYVLPLKLTSETDSISTEKDKLLLIMDISSPEIALIITDSDMDVDVNKTPEVSLFTQIMGVDENTQTVSCKVTKDDVDALVADYNSEKNTSYTALPSNAYQLNDGDEAVLNFTPGTLYSKLKITFIKENITPLKEYLLPIKLVKGDGIDVDETVYYITLGDYSSLQEIALIKDDIRTDYGSKSSEKEWDQGSLVDNDLNTFWHSVYGSKFKCHKTYGHSVDFNVGKNGALTNIMFEYTTRTTYANGYPVEFAIYVCDERLDDTDEGYTWDGDSSDWRLLAKFTKEQHNLPQDKGKTFRSGVLTSEQPFKWLRFSVTKGNDGTNELLINNEEKGFFSLSEIDFWGN